jgi:excisionase family DNA binding protein
MKALPEPENVSSEESLWDAQDVARYLKVSRSWVYHQAEAGLLPYLRVGGLLRFDPDTIRAYAKGAGVRSKIVPFPPRSQ